MGENKVMRNDPSLDNLLDIACEALRNDIIPTLSGQTRYQALMVANAISIVKRQIASEKNERFEDKIKVVDFSNSDTYQIFNQRPALEIRNGIHNPSSPSFDMVYDYLLNLVEKKVEESNPRYTKNSKVN